MKTTNSVRRHKEPDIQSGVGTGVEVNHKRDARSDRDPGLKGKNIPVVNVA